MAANSPRLIVLTGVTRGLGRAMAERFIEVGHTVLGCGRSAVELDVLRLMNASHASLRDDFAVSSRELDVMVECGRAHPACQGIRMTGAGFGGCAVALVHAGNAEAFTSSVAASYQSATGIKPILYVCTATDGAVVS